MPDQSNHLDPKYTLTTVDDIQAALFELGHADSRITVRNAADQEFTVEILALDNITRRFYWRPRDYAGADFANTNPQQWLVGSTFRFQADGYGGVQIHFRVNKPQIVRTYNGSPALVSPFPDQLKRIQRRNAFRVQVANTRLIATATWQPDLTCAPLTFQVRDLSIDGIGMRANQPISSLPSVGSHMQHLALNFGKHGDMLVDLVVHNLYPLGRQEEEGGEEEGEEQPFADVILLDVSLSHLGGRFVGLDARQKSRLQKIVWAIEKTRAALRA